eukprot:COSAG02_NODE_30893_length_543_cov_0.914414_1_plen_53_part_01
MKIGGRDVTIPQGKPVKNPECPADGSTFSQSEFLVYDEAQVRIRYAVTFKWG